MTGPLTSKNTIHSLYEFRKNLIWIKEYPIRYAGTTFNARMTIVNLFNKKLLIHSPCEIDAKLKAEIEALGSVAYIVAPGNYHYFFVTSAQTAFPNAEVLLCPGVEAKLPNLKFDGFLGDGPDPRWEKQMDQVLIQGNDLMWEVAFFIRESKTLLLVDLIENFTDQTQGVNWLLKLWMKFVFRMWGKPKPAPEYRLGWSDKKQGATSLQKILSWDFDNIIISHGELIEENARELALRAWKSVLSNL